MSEVLNWYKQEKTLVLYGELNRDTLLTLWQKKRILLEGIQFLNVTNLKRIDSAGVALMLHFYHYQKCCGVGLTLTGVHDKLRTLITLYKLQTIIPCIMSKKKNNLQPGNPTIYSDRLVC